MRDAEAKKAGLLAAATEEFGRFGLAGGRVDRIAAAAGCNKQLIYAYFGSKEGLFDAVMGALVAKVVSTVPIDPDDLPGYAGRLMAFTRQEPWMSRLSLWWTLERSDEAGEALAIAHEATGLKLAKVAQAQEEGRIDAELGAEELVALVQGLAHTWAIGLPSPSLGPEAESALWARRQAAVEEAARRILLVKA